MYEYDPGVSAMTMITYEVDTAGLSGLDTEQLALGTRVCRARSVHSIGERACTGATLAARVRVAVSVSVEVAAASCAATISTSSTTTAKAAIAPVAAASAWSAVSSRRRSTTSC